MQACFPLLTHPTSVILLLAEMWNPSQLSQQLRVLTEEEMEKIAKEEQLWVFKHSFNLFRMPIAKDPWFLAVTSLNMFSLICSMMWHFSGRQHVHTHQITLRLPNIHWYPSSQVHKNFQFFSSYSDCKTYLATLWKQILSLRTGFEWNKRIGQWTTSPWSAGDRTSCSAWRFVFNISLWDWHASHRIRVLYVSSNRLDCHYLKSFFFFFFFPFDLFCWNSSFHNTCHLSYLAHLQSDSYIHTVCGSVMVPYTVAMLKVTIWISFSLPKASICYMLCPNITKSCR